MLGDKCFAPQLLSVCLPIKAVVLSLCLPPSYDYLYLRPRKKEWNRYRKKEHKKAADTFNVITDFNRV